MVKKILKNAPDGPIILISVALQADLPSRQALAAALRSFLGLATMGRSSGRRFDREHGVTTAAIFFLSQLGDTRAAEFAHATHYEPVPPDVFARLLGHVPELFVPAATFVDIGSGMGRGVLLASQRPFKQIVGVELLPALHEIAADNLAKVRGLNAVCRDVRLRQADAAKFNFPKGNLVVFLFNPFDDVVLTAVLERIVASRRAGDRALLLYHVPVHREVVMRYAAETIADDDDGLAVWLRVA